MSLIKLPKEFQRMAFAVAFALLWVLLEVSFSVTKALTFDQKQDGYFLTGRWVGAFHFVVFYALFVYRLSVVNKPKRLIKTSRLFSLFVALTTVVFVMGMMDLQPQLNSVLAGVMSMSLAVSYVMALSPLILPSRMVFGMPELRGFNKRTGLKQVDDYLGALEINSKLKAPVSVLILEDDLSEASSLIHHFVAHKMACMHVTSISEAERVFNDYRHGIEVIVLANYVNAGESSCKTGFEWAQLLSEKFPLGNRDFSVVMLTAHAHFLEDATSVLDLVLNKPFDSSKLNQHLIQQKDVK